MTSGFIHIIACDRISFLFETQWYFIVCMYHILLICSSVSEHLGCFYLLAIVNTAAINTGMQVSLQDSAFSYFVYLPRSGIAKSYGNSIFNLLKVLHAKYFPWWFHCFIIPPLVHKNFNLATSSPTFYFFLKVAILMSMSDISLWFWFAFLWWLVILNIFS